MGRVLVAAGGCVLGTTAPAARADNTDTGAILTIREAKNGEIVFTGSAGHIKHRFAIVAQTAEPATVIEVNVPDFTDAAGDQFPTRWAWVGTPPKTIGLRVPAEILVECDLPAPATYTTQIEVIYSFSGTVGKELTRSVRVPIRFDRTAVVRETDLPVVAAAGDTVTATMLYGPTTAHVEIALRGTAGKSVAIDKAILVTAPRKGTGSQLVTNDVSAIVTTELPATVPYDAVCKVEIEVSGIDEPGTYEGKMLFVNSATGATKETSFTIVVKRSVMVAFILIALGVIVSWRARAWLQKGHALASSRRNLGRLRDALSRLVAGPLGDVERSAADEFAKHIDVLLRDIGDDSEPAGLEAAVARLWKRVALLQAVGEARRTVALIPGAEDRRGPGLALESIAAAIARDIDDTEVKAQQSKLQALDIENAFRAAVTNLASRLRERLDARAAAHPETHAQWDEIRGHIDASDQALAGGRVFEARGSLTTGYRIFVKQLGARLRALAAEPPPHGEESEWRIVRGDLDRILDQLDASSDVEQMARFQARALTLFLRAALPAFAMAVRAESKQRHSAKSEFDVLAARAGALLAQSGPDDDDKYRALLVEYQQVITETPKSIAPGGIQTAGAPDSWVAPVPMIQTEVDSQLSVLRAVLPATDILTARIRMSSCAVDTVLFVLAVLTGLQILWIGNATWGNLGDLLACLLWGTGVYSVGQTVARGLLGLKMDWLKGES